MAHHDTITISRRKVKSKAPVQIGKRDFYYNYYVDKVFAGRSSSQVYDYISHMRHEAGHFDSPGIQVVREACEMAVFSDATIIRLSRGWTVSIE